MLPIIEQHQPQLSDLCRRYSVRRLELFGSAAAGRFNPQASDLDFLVEFNPPPNGRLADQYFDLLASLEDLFRSRVDLVEPSAIRNPYFRQGIDQARVLLYDDRS